MVYDNLARFGPCNRLGKTARAARLVEVEAQKQVGLGNEFCGELGVSCRIDNLLGAGKGAEIGKALVRDDCADVFTYSGKNMRCSQTRAYSVAVGACVAHRHYTLRALYQGLCLRYCGFVYLS